MLKNKKGYMEQEKGRVSQIFIEKLMPIQIHDE